MSARRSSTGYWIGNGRYIWNLRQSALNGRRTSRKRAVALMIYLISIYVIILIGWSILEIQGLRKSVSPRWIILAEIASKVGLFAGIVLYVAHIGHPTLISIWQFAAWPIIALEIFLRT